MKIDDGVYNRGRARVVIQSDPMRGNRRMYVMLHGVDGAEYIVTMDDGSMTLEKMEEGVSIDEEDVMLVWDQHDDLVEVVQDVFGAIAMALGMSGDERQAREMGRLEGENAVYKQMFDKAPPPKVNEDWARYINQPVIAPYTTPGYSGGLTVTNGINSNSMADLNEMRLPDPGPMSVSHTHIYNYEEENAKKQEGPFGGAP